MDRIRTYHGADGGKIADTLRKRRRLARQARGLGEEPLMSHPTKKATEGRKRHFNSKVGVRMARAKMRYENLLQRLYMRYFPFEGVGAGDSTEASQAHGAAVQQRKLARRAKLAQV